MVSIFDFSDYKKFVKEWVISRPNNGFGQFSRMAKAIDSSSVVVSQIFKGKRHLSPEQTLELTKFLGHTDAEQEYFIHLVALSKAGSEPLRNYHRSRLEELRKETTSLKAKVSHQKMKEVEQAVFYSRWIYSAIRLASDIQGMNAFYLSELYDLDLKQVNEALHFLKSVGLVDETANGLKLGPKVTHVGFDSPFVTVHHRNWRQKAVQAMERQRSQDLFYTGPMVLSEKLAQTLRSRFADLVKEVTEDVKKSPSEAVWCFNFDWFKV